MISEVLLALKSELKPPTLLDGVLLPRGSVQVRTCKASRRRTKLRPRRSPPGLAREAKSAPSMNLAMKLEAEPHFRNQVNAERDRAVALHVSKRPCPCLRGPAPPVQAPASPLGWRADQRELGRPRPGFI